MSQILRFDEGFDYGDGPIRSDEAEMATLGTALLPNAPAAYLAKLEPEDFYRPAHKHICRAMKTLIADRKPVDLVTLREELKDKELLGAVGGQEYLNELDIYVPSVVNGDAYAGTVLDKWARRDPLSGLSEAEAAIRQARPFSEIGQLLRGLDAAMMRAQPPKKERSWRDLERGQRGDRRVQGLGKGLRKLDPRLRGLSRHPEAPAGRSHERSAAPPPRRQVGVHPGTALEGRGVTTPDTTLRDNVSARTRSLCDELMGRGFYGRWSAEFDGPRIRLALEVVRFGDPFGVEHVTWARPRHYRRGNAMVRLLRRALR